MSTPSWMTDRRKPPVTFVKGYEQFVPRETKISDAQSEANYRAAIDQIASENEIRRMERIMAMGYANEMADAYKVTANFLRQFARKP